MTFYMVFKDPGLLCLVEEEVAIKTARMGEGECWAQIFMHFVSSEVPVSEG